MDELVEAYKELCFAQARIISLLRIGGRFGANKGHWQALERAERKVAELEQK